MQVEPSLRPCRNGLVSALETEMRLKLKCDELLSSSAFNFNLRPYNEDDGYLIYLEYNAATHLTSVVVLVGAD